MDLIPGALSEAKPADERIQGMCDTVKRALETEINTSFPEYRPIAYKTQVVSGTNYYIKINVGGTEHIHVIIFEPLPASGDPPQLEGIQLKKTADDEITYF